MSVVERAMQVGLHAPVVRLADSRSWQEQIAYQEEQGVTPATDRVIIRGFEPGGTQIGLKIRKILLETDDLSSELTPLANLLLFYANRMQLYTEANRIFEEYPNSIALLDRCDWSTVVFQGMDFEKRERAAGGEDVERQIRNMDVALSNFSHGFTKHVERQLGRSYPGYVILLDGNPEELAIRAGINDREKITEKNHRDDDKLEARRRLRERYLRFAAANLKRCMLVNVHEDFDAALRSGLGAILACVPQGVRNFISRDRWGCSDFRLWDGQFATGSLTLSYHQRRTMHTELSIETVRDGVYALWTELGLGDFVPEL